MKTFRVIMWAEDEEPNTDPFDFATLPVVRTRSRETFMFQTASQSEAVKRFKQSLGILAAEK